MKRHLLSAADLTHDDAVLVLDTARELAAVSTREVKKLPTLRGRTVVNLFFEDSTRTRISFEAAAKRLSADVINFSAKGSSVSKGESLKDTAMTLQAMGADGVVIRHGASGAPHRLANSGWIEAAVVNAGDGTHEHPTQALLDAYTMRHHLAGGEGDLAGQRVTIVGDVLHSRVARSNVLLLHTLGAQVTLVAPPTLLPVGVETWPCEVSYDLDAPLPDTDAVMMLRVQRERMGAAFFPSEREYSRRYGLDAPSGRHAARACDRDASGTDEPRHGDHRGGRRRAALGHRRTGHQRRERADGRALPAARRTLMTYLITGVRPLGGQAVDLRIEGETITGIGAAGSVSADGATVVDAEGLIALPGLVDLHTHLREPGREDAETVLTGSRAAALGGFTAVHAMANTDPVADTAGVVEQVWHLGKSAGLVDVFPVGAVTVGLGGQRLAELGAMADSDAGVRVFSDDGKCVSDAVLMRRALEYVKAFDGVIAQHSQEPRLTEDAQMNEGELSGRLGLRGWPAVAEEAIIARDVLLAEHVGSRLHVCHVSTAGSVEILRWAKSRGIDVTAEVTPHHLLLSEDLAGDLRPGLQGQPAAAPGRGRRGRARRPRRRDHRHRRHGPRPAPHGGQGVRVGRSGLRHARPGAGAGGGHRHDGRPRPAGLGRGGPRDVRRVRRRSAAAPVMAARSPRVSRRTWSSSTRSGRATVEPAGSASKSRNNPYAGRDLPAPVVATFLRGRATVLDRALVEHT